MIQVGMRPMAAKIASAIRRVLAPADAAMNRLYGWKLNPLYHSGALAVALLVVVLVTGIYLLFFYRVGAPYESVERLTDQVWLGRWIRTLHRYASDAAVVAALIHALRFYAQGRTWGPRALAWISGLILVFVILVCGWTGYVMVWDVQGIVLAREGARLLDTLPLFAEPIGRLFAGEVALPSAFFFLNLFLHVALPVGLGVVLWIHVARVARPALLPPRKLMWGVGSLLLATSVLWPVGMEPKADFFLIAESAAFDAFYSFWLPVTQLMPGVAAWAGGIAISTALVLIPSWSKPRIEDKPGASVVNEQLCQSCEQCYLDCPYEAISMVTLPDSGKLVARVDPGLCVSCGICIGSCAPMGVGPPGRTGRDQLKLVREYVRRHELTAADVALVGCSRGAGGVAETTEFHRAPVFAVDCVGSLHTSTVEYLVRSGVGGVLIVACPGRDCWNREGVKWLNERLYSDREAELKARVDRRRLRVVHAGEAEPLTVLAELELYRKDIAILAAAERETDIVLDESCHTDQELVQ